MEHAIVLSDDGIIRLENLPEDVQAEAREKQFAIPHMKGDTQSETVEVKSIGTEIPIEHAVKQPASTAPAASEQSDEILSLEEMERRHILHALSVCEGNRTEVCKRLGISRATLWRKLKELKIQMEGEET